MKVVNPTFLFRHGCSTTGDVFVKLKYLSLQPIVDECLISAIFSLSLSLSLSLFFNKSLFAHFNIFLDTSGIVYAGARAREREREQIQGDANSSQGWRSGLGWIFYQTVRFKCTMCLWLFPCTASNAPENCATLHFSA